MNKINFFLPAEICKSSIDEHGREVMEMEGIASTTDQDSDEEELNPSGYDLKPFLDNGIVNWNHRSKDNPDTVVGEPVIATITPDNKMYVKVRLYPDMEKARQVYNLGKVLEKNSSTRKLGFSIEGIPLERDPFNKKRILKAKITGLAITPTPKNKNTFASIVKGEYSEPFVEEEEDEEIEKMITTSTVAPTTEESLEGVKKQENIKKSQVYGLISKSLDTKSPEVLIKVYDFITENNMSHSVEEIEKALSTLKDSLVKNNEETIEKGESTNQVEQKEVQKIEKSEDVKEDTIEKGEQKEETEIEKSAKECWEKGMTASSLAESLIRKGYPLDLSVSTANSIISKMESERQGGTIEKMPEVSSSISKSEVSEMIEESNNKQLESFEKSLESKFDSVIETFKSIAVSSAEKIEELEKEVELQKGENEKLSKSLKEPNPRKSVTTYKERFDEENIEKSNSSTSLIDSFDMSSREGRESLCDAILEKKQESIVKGEDFDDEILKAIPSIEISGVVTNPKLLQKLRILFKD